MKITQGRRAFVHMSDNGETISGPLKRRTASGADNTSGGSNTPSDSTGNEVLLPMMVPQRSDENPEARGVLFDASPRIPAPTDRHWFVNATDYPGYCAACSLPRANRRHTPRVAA